MKDENGFLLVTSLIFAIIASIFCASEWFYGNHESALFLTAGSAIAIAFYAVMMALRQIRKNETTLEQKLGKLEEKIGQIENARATFETQCVSDPKPILQEKEELLA
jgi:septal ring factor EnvC (AmiA/AmiB activator)